MTRFLFIGLICFSHALMAQVNYSIKPLFDLNSNRSEVAAAAVSGQLVVAISSTESVQQLQSEKVSTRTSYRKWKRGGDFSDWTSPELYLPGRWHAEGSFSFSETEQRVYFASTKNFDGAKGNHAKLYFCNRIGEKWDTPKLLPINSHGADCLHPCFNSELRILVFSSNRMGGLGGMDLWYCAQTEGGWTDPLNLGLGVNSAANEVFPSFHKGDIFYATNAADTWGGYDIRRALGSNQWKTAIAEGAPFNSAADDMFVFFLDDERAVLTSNRAGGLGGDDLFLLTQEPSSKEKHQMTARLSCEGHVLGQMKVTVISVPDGLIQTLSTDEDGKLDIRSLRMGKSYEIQLDTTQAKDFSRCKLIVNDSDGNRYQEVSFSDKGMALLELLPFLLCDFYTLNNEDQSLLSLEFEGQLFKDIPGDVGLGEPITILNSKGEPVAIAYTNDSGKFRFTKLDPQSNYVMRLSAESEAEHALIMDGGKKIDIPVLNAEIHYQRIDPEKALALVNENNDTIYVSSEDLFVINRIYFGYNSVQVTSESIRQLEQLATIMERNPKVSLELRSHTDSRGDSAYNLRLSEQRAKSAIQYLLGTGLDIERFRYKGLGESELLNECIDGVSCTEPEHAINRRTEIRFKLLGSDEACGF